MATNFNTNHHFFYKTISTIIIVAKYVNPPFLVRGGLTLDEGIYIAQIVAQSGIFSIQYSVQGLQSA